MSRGAVVVLAAGLLIGCGGGRSEGGSAGSAGAGGAGIVGGSGGTAGGAAAGSGASSADAGDAAAETAGGLPACRITTRQQDPVNGDAGLDTQGMACNTLTPAGDWIVPEVFSWADGGAQVDGGLPQSPVGGVILDGDYDLVRFQVRDGPGQTTRRSIRVFEGGRYIEWALAIQNPSSDGGVEEIWYDTTAMPNGHDLGASSTCNAVLSLDGYSAEGDTLTFFVYLQSMNDPPIGIDTYRRVCSR
jgi:hypothetical protein